MQDRTGRPQLSVLSTRRLCRTLISPALLSPPTQLTWLQQQPATCPKLCGREGRAPGPYAQILLEGLVRPERTPPREVGRLAPAGQASQGDTSTAGGSNAAEWAQSCQVLQEASERLQVLVTLTQHRATSDRTPSQHAELRSIISNLIAIALKLTVSGLCIWTNTRLSRSAEYPCDRCRSDRHICQRRQEFAMRKPACQRCSTLRVRCSLLESVSPSIAGS